MVMSELMGFGKREPLGRKGRELGTLVSAVDMGPGVAVRCPAGAQGPRGPLGQGSREMN